MTKSRRKSPVLRRHCLATHPELRQFPQALPSQNLVVHSTTARNTRVNDAYMRPSRNKGTLGAVVLTLKATGCALWFVMANARLTCCVRGPAHDASAFGQCRRQTIQTVEAEIIARGERDRHFEGRRSGRG